MATKRAKTSEEAWEMQDTREAQARGWIQWKGTNVCMDVLCDCGEAFHIDAEFAYHVVCPLCGACYFCNGHIELIEVEEIPESGVARVGDEEKTEWVSEWEIIDTA